MARPDRNDRIRSRQLPLSADGSRRAQSTSRSPSSEVRRSRSSAKTARARRRSSSSSTRLFEPTAGRILLNGIDASRFSPRSVQGEMSIIFQDYGQYQMTARENIGLSRTDKLEEDAAIQRAGEKSGAAEVVDDLPEGYETMLGRLFPGGRQLSGGQWQRLALGRLYFRPASVQIFDEPTAALDAIAEAAMIDRLREHGQDRITAADFTPFLDRAPGRQDHRASRRHGRRIRRAYGSACPGRHLRHVVQLAGARLLSAVTS